MKILIFSHFKMLIFYLMTSVCPVECEKGYRQDAVMLGSEAYDGMNDELPFNISASVSTDDGVIEPPTTDQPIYIPA